MRLALGSDHRGYDALHRLADHLRGARHEVIVLGPSTKESCDYPDAAYAVAMAVSRGQADMGVLFDGTGIGSCISANKVKGIRAALVHDEITAEMSRSHNDANVICLSADLLGMRLITQIVDTCLKTPFADNRHSKRVKKIVAIEEGRDPGDVG